MPYIFFQAHSRMPSCSCRWTTLFVLTSLSYCTTSPLTLRINVDHLREDLDSNFSSLASSVSYEGSMFWTETTEERLTFTTGAPHLEQLGLIPATSLPKNQSHLLPSLWTGDGIARNYDLVSEELILIGEMKQFGRLTSPANVLQAIQTRLPNTDWTLENVEARIKEIKDRFIVPGWFHQITLTHYAENRVVDIDMLLALFERTSQQYQQSHSPIDLSQRAFDWVAQCIEPLFREYPQDPSCIEVYLLNKARAVVARAWSLTAPEILQYMDEIEISEMTRLELVYGLFDLDPVPTSSSKSPAKRSRTEAEESRKKSRSPKTQRTIKWHLMSFLLMRPTLSVEEITTRINEELLRSRMAERVGADQIQLMKTDILRPTQTTNWIHEQLNSLPSEVTAEQFIEAHRSRLPEDFTVDSFNIWFEFCIEPLRTFEASDKRGWRPCIEEGGRYRLTYKAVSAYLRHQMRRES